MLNALKFVGFVLRPKLRRGGAVGVFVRCGDCGGYLGSEPSHQTKCNNYTSQE